MIYYTQNWTFKSLGRWHFVIGQSVPSVSTDHSMFIFRVKLSKKNSSWTTHPTTYGCNPKDWFFSNNAMWTSHSHTHRIDRYLDFNHHSVFWAEHIQTLGPFPSSAVQSKNPSCSQSPDPHCMYQIHSSPITTATAQTKLILHCLSLSHFHTSTAIGRTESPEKLLTNLMKEWR